MKDLPKKCNITINHETIVADYFLLIFLRFIHYLYFFTCFVIIRNFQLKKKNQTFYVFLFRYYIDKNARIFIICKMVIFLSFRFHNFKSKTQYAEMEYKTTFEVLSHKNNTNRMFLLLLK